MGNSFLFPCPVRAFRRFVLARHRLLLLNKPDTDRALELARCYVTAMDVYKLIVCEPGPVDLSSLVETLPPGAAFHPGTRQVRSRPIRFLELLKSGVRRVQQHPLITGLSDRMVWTSGPISSPLCNSAHWVEQAKASFAFFWRAPYSLLAQAHILWPGLVGEVRAHRAPVLLTDSSAVSWVVPRERNLAMQRFAFASKAILQDLYGLPDASISVIFALGSRRSELRGVPEAL